MDDSLFEDTMKNPKLAPRWKSNILLKWSKVSPVYLMKGKKT